MSNTPTTEGIVLPATRSLEAGAEIQTPQLAAETAVAPPTTEPLINEFRI